MERSTIETRAPPAGSVHLTSGSAHKNIHNKPLAFLLSCAVFSFERLAQKQRNEIMYLHRVNEFTHLSPNPHPPTSPTRGLKLV